MASLYGRWFVAGALSVLAISTGPWQLLLFAAIDLAGSIWTFLALRATSDEGAPAT
ncbi:MAG: hypothetical protein ACRDWH_04995 [Acidimicrobiia bacterium]